MSAAHHDDGHEAFDPEPVAEIGADETPSPSWLPIVGAALFTLGVGWVFYPGADAIAKAPEPTPVASAAKPAASGAAKRLVQKPSLGEKKKPGGGEKKPRDEKSPSGDENKPSGKTVTREDLQKMIENRKKP